MAEALGGCKQVATLCGERHRTWMHCPRSTVVCLSKRLHGIRACSVLFSFPGTPNAGNPATTSTVSRLTLITLPIRRTIYCGSSARFGSFTIPLRLSVFTLYWSITHSNADRLPSR